MACGSPARVRAIATTTHNDKTVACASQSTELNWGNVLGCQRGYRSMSSPSGKPFDPINLSDYASQRTRERNLEHETDDGDDDPDVSPYAPKRRRRVRADPDADPIHSAPPLTVVHAADLHAAADLQPTHPDDHQPAQGEASLDRRTGDPVSYAEDPIDERRLPDEASSEIAHDITRLAGLNGFRPAAAKRPSAAAASESSPYRPASEDGLHGMESSLAWLRRGAPTPAQPAAAASARARSAKPLKRTHEAAGTVINGVRVPPSLDPQRMPPAAAGANGLALRWPLIAMGAGLVALPAFYLVLTLTTPAPVRAPQLASIEGAGLFVGQPPIRAEEPSPEPVEMVAALPAAQPPQQSIVVKRPASPEPEAAAIRPALPEPVDAAPSPPPRALDPEMIALLIKQGEQLIASGDLITARVAFQRAAESGDATAAMALGATYDPTVVARLGIRGIAPDIEKARYWYRTAKDFGSAEAPRRLELLANR
jgi:hypothetical protein